MLKKDRKYYRIGEVSRIVGVESHVLRFWEKEFKQIRPRRVSGQRLYRKQDLETIQLIKQLLYNEGFTIAGARKQLESLQRSRQARVGSGQTGADSKCQILEEIRRELSEIRQILLS